MDNPIKKLFQRKNRVSIRPTYASKDFVEHLRTVHFALTTISAALLLILMSAKPYDSQKAIIQIEQILKLKKVWTPEWLWAHHQSPSSHENVDEYFSSLNQEFPSAKQDELPTDLSKRWDILVEYKNPDSALPPFEIELPPEDKWVQVEEGRREFPTTFRELIVWWSNLRDHPFHMFRPEKIAGQCSYGEMFKLGSDPHCKLFSEQNHVRFWRPQKKLPSTFWRFTLPTRSNDEAPIVFLRAKAKTFQNSDTFSIWIIVIAYAHTTISQQDARVMFPEWSKGDFATTFPDLYRAAQGFGSFELEDVAKHLSTDIRATEVFEAFGLKIPAEQVTVWGVLIIIGVQLYLFVYLKSLKNPLQPSDPAWEVGWIATNEAVLPRCMLFTTIFVLPLMAVALLTAHDFDQALGQAGLKWDWTFISIKKLPPLIVQFKHTALFACGCILTFILGYLNWRNRPRLGMEQPQIESPPATKLEPTQ